MTEQKNVEYTLLTSSISATSHVKDRVLTKTYPLKVHWKILKSVKLFKDNTYETTFLQTMNVSNTELAVSIRYRFMSDAKNNPKCPFKLSDIQISEILYENDDNTTHTLWHHTRVFTDGLHILMESGYHAGQQTQYLMSGNIIVYYEAKK